ncbi:MAG: hypothetical protein ACPW61_02140 [Methyloligella sp. ZOD6]
MRKGSLTIAASAALLMASAGSAFAFKEVETAPPTKPPPEVEAEASKTPGLSVAPTASELGTPMSADAVQPNDVQIFSFGVLPSLDFGLDVLYGHSEDPALKPTGKSDDEVDDIGVVGTVKRRF